MRPLLLLSLCVAACGGPLTDETSDDLARTPVLEAQSFVHGTLKANDLARYTVQGTSGETLAPDVWPTSTGPLRPTLELWTPADSHGARKLVATSAARGGPAGHQGISQRLAATGAYQLVVRAGAVGGRYTLRLWSSASHAPRSESVQLDLALRVSASTQDALHAHQGWTDAELQTVLASVRQQTDAMVALSDLHELWLAVSPSQVAAVRDDVVNRLSTPTKQVRAFALFWFGDFGELLFHRVQLQDVQLDTAPRSRIGHQIDSLEGGWSGAHETSRAVDALVTADGQTFGFVARWEADQLDTDGTPVWSWLSTDWFDPHGLWLGEQSQGASEADSD